MRRIAVLTFALLSFVPASAVRSADATASPGPSDSPRASLLPGSSEAARSLDLIDPAWSRVRASRGPAAREDHTWTVDAAGRHAYLFGGRDGGRVFDDLWRFDLEGDTWTRLAPRGPSPEARSGHSAVWMEGIGLVVFAGQRGADFLGDLWAYDPLDERWAKLPADGAAPRPRYGSCLIVGRDGRLWMSHGFTFEGRFDDTRAYDLVRERWAAVAQDGRRPGERCLHDCFTSAGGELVLFGGQDDEHVALGDLWATRPDGSWRKLPEPDLRARRLYAVAEAGEDAWIFGGAGRDNELLDDLWRVDRSTLAFERVRVDGPSPVARSAGTLISDPARGRLLLFGGMARAARSDLWQLTDAAASAPPSSLPTTSPGA